MFKNNLNQLDIPFLINMDKSVEEFEWRWRLEYNRDILWFGGVRQFGAKYITGGNPVW